MNLLELVTFLRTDILDDTGGVGVDWTNYSESDFGSVQLRWTNEELVSKINEAINQVYRRTTPIKDLINISLVAGVNEYTLPSYVLQIENVKRENGEKLRIKSVDDLWDLKEYKTKVADPIYYIPDTILNTLRVFPIPISDEIIDLLIYRLPKTKLSWDDPDGIPELKQEYHVPALFYAAHLCYLKDEANTLDPQRATSFLAMFDREFPFTSAYSNIRKGRTTNRAVRYGGL